MLIEAVDLAAGKAGSDNNILNKHTNTRREFYTIEHIKTIFYFKLSHGYHGKNS